MKPVPKINRMEKSRKRLFMINAIINALKRNASIPSFSNFSFENTIRLKPARSNISVISSATFVRNVANVLVSRKEEYNAKTGILYLKSNKE